MGDPGSATLTILAPLADTPANATHFSACMLSPRSPIARLSPREKTCSPSRVSGPVGKAQTVQVRVAPGSILTSPLVVSLADDGGGSFVNNPVTIAGSPGYALAGYLPATAGLRTMSVTV
jgi:hypothetical protein